MRVICRITVLVVVVVVVVVAVVVVVVVVVLLLLLLLLLVLSILIVVLAVCLVCLPGWSPTSFGCGQTGVNTNGAAAKVMYFDGLEEKVRPGTFGKIKEG